MKIIGDNFDTEENILKLISKSTPSSNSELTFDCITNGGGWIYVTGNIIETKFSINYSELVFDTAIFVQFFAELINLEDEITIFLDYEGSYPLLYAKKGNNDTIRFLFAHDYILFKNNEEWEDCLQHKIEFDILINKKDLLSKIYIILYRFLKNYDLDYAEYIDFNIEKAKEYLNTIQSYLDKNITLEEKKLIEEKINEKSEELSDFVKELIKPENCMGPFETTEEMMQAIWDSEDDEEEEDDEDEDDYGPGNELHWR